MKTMFRAQFNYGPFKVKEFPVTKTTEKTVFFLLNHDIGSTRVWREAVEAKDHSWHETFEEAKAKVVRLSGERAQATKRQLESEQKWLLESMEQKL